MAVKVKMIQSVDSIPGKDTTVYFTDGTTAKVKAGNKLSKMLSQSDAVAPHMVKVTITRGIISDAEVVDVEGGG